MNKAQAEAQAQAQPSQAELLKAHWIHLEGKPGIDAVSTYVLDAIDVQDPAIAALIPQLLPVAGSVVELTYTAPSYAKDFDAALTLKNNTEKIAALREEIAALIAANAEIESGRGTWLGYAHAIAQQLANTVPGKILLKSAIQQVPASNAGSGSKGSKSFTEFLADRSTPKSEGSHPMNYAITVDGSTLYLRGPYELAQNTTLREYLGTQATQLRDLALELKLTTAIKEGTEFTVNGHAVKVIGR